jgi:hypothetical protein
MAFVFANNPRIRATFGRDRTGHRRGRKRFGVVFPATSDVSGSSKPVAVASPGCLIVRVRRYSRHQKPDLSTF